MNKQQKKLSVIFSPKRKKLGITLYNKKTGRNIMGDVPDILPYVEFYKDWSYKIYIVLDVELNGMPIETKVPLKDIAFTFDNKNFPFDITVDYAFMLTKSQESIDEKDMNSINAAKANAHVT